MEDELFLQYYEVDPVDILQRAYEKTLVECKEEVSLPTLFFNLLYLVLTTRICHTGRDRVIDCFVGGFEKRRTAIG